MLISAFGNSPVIGENERKVAFRVKKPTSARSSSTSCFIKGDLQRQMSKQKRIR